MTELQPLARALILFGAVLVLFGTVLLVAPKLPWLGRLPGDIFIRREHVSFYFPLTSSLIASALVSVLWWLTSRFRP